ncbi:MAG: hypothetical protein ACTSRU_09720 [Candidatus Hodarchaeales archaeon]
MFFNGSEIEGSKRNQTFFGNIFKFVLACWDYVRGHEICAAYPDNLMKDQRFCKKVFSHSIWFLGDSMGDTFKNERIDIEFQGLVLSAFYLPYDGESKADMPMDFIMFIESPIERTELLDRMQPMLKQRILEDIGTDLYYIVEKHRLSAIKIKKSGYKSKISKGEKVEQKLQEIWESLAKEFVERDKEKESVESSEQVPGTLEIETSESAVKADLSPPRKPVLVQRAKLFQTKTIDIQTEVADDKNGYHVVVRNSLRDLEDVTVSVSHVSEFFSENVFIESIGLLGLQEKLVFEFPRENEEIEYLIEVKEGNKSLAIKKVVIPKAQQDLE